MLLRVLCVIIQSPCPLHVFYLILKSPNSYYENPEIYIMMQPILICTVYINTKCIYIIKLLIRWYMHYLIIINNLTILYGKYKNSQSHIKVTHLFYPNSPTSNILCHPSPPPPPLIWVGNNRPIYETPYNSDQNDTLHQYLYGQLGMYRGSDKRLILINSGLLTLRLPSGSGYA